MKTTKIKIRNLFGITETELDGKNVEVTGKNGVGKTSIIDAIKYALTNDSERDYILKKGESEGEILIETDTGLYIDRKKRANQADYKSIKDGGKVVSSPEAMLKTIFTPLQLDLVKFIQLSKKEQNRAILDLIEFDWDLKWIKAAEDKLTTLESKLTDKIELAESAYREKVAKLDSDMQVADEYINKEKVDTSVDEEEVKTAEEMKKHLNEFYRMKRLQEECEKLADESNEYTEKIELARELPGKILETATIPAEKLSDENRAKLYEKCKASGLQFIATRTTNGEDMEVNYL